MMMIHFKMGEALFPWDFKKPWLQNGRMIHVYMIPG